MSDVVRFSLFMYALMATMGIVTALVASTSPREARQVAGISIIWPLFLLFVVGRRLYWMVSDLLPAERKPNKVTKARVMREDARYRDSAYMPTDSEEE